MLRRKKAEKLGTPNEIGWRKIEEKPTPSRPGFIRPRCDVQLVSRLQESRAVVAQTRLFELFRKHHGRARFSFALGISPRHFCQKKIPGERSDGAWPPVVPSVSSVDQFSPWDEGNETEGRIRNFVEFPMKFLVFRESTVVWFSW